ncbi:hypothetical protein NUM3379_25330 [Kineococcus sp. NUM-3379]
MQSILLPVGSETVAVPIGQVREVLTAPVVTPLATPSPAVLGLANLRGDVLPVLDTARLVGVTPCGRTDMLVVVDTAAGPVALAVAGSVSKGVLGRRVDGCELPGREGVYAGADGAVVLLDLAAALDAAGLGAGAAGVEGTPA